MSYVHGTVHLSSTSSYKALQPV